MASSDAAWSWRPTQEPGSRLKSSGDEWDDLVLLLLLAFFSNGLLFFTEKCSVFDTIDSLEHVSRVDFSTSPLSTQREVVHDFRNHRLRWRAENVLQGFRMVAHTPKNQVDASCTNLQKHLSVHAPPKKMKRHRQVAVFTFAANDAPSDIAFRQTFALP